MLDVRFDRVSAERDRSSVLEACDLYFPGSSHSALIGSAGSGKSTLLALVRGSLIPRDGAIVIGTRVSNRIRPAHRPVLSVEKNLISDSRKTVEHLLLTSLRPRVEDREERLSELERLISEWGLERSRQRGARTLSSEERVRLTCAEIEASRPAVLLLERFAGALTSFAARPILMQLYRMLRVARSTVISEPAHEYELGLVERVVVLERKGGGRAATSREVFLSPGSELEASASGSCTLVPVEVRDGEVFGPAGVWNDTKTTIGPRAMAVLRPRDFHIVARGEENDLILTVEEASFVEGEWWVTGMLTGSITLTVALRTSEVMHKGKLLALRLRSGTFPLLPSTHEGVVAIPTDVIPSQRDSR